MFSKLLALLLITTNAYAANLSLQGDVSGPTTSNTVNTVGGKSAAAVATSVSDTQAATSVDTSGNTIVKRSSGGFTAGDVTVDNLTLAQFVKSALIPNSSSAYDLGSAVKGWRNLYVAGTGYLNNLDQTNILIGASGHSYFSQTGSRYMEIDLGANLSTDTRLQFNSITTRVINFDDGNYTVAGLNLSQVFTNKTFDDPVTMKEVNLPATPAAGYVKVYPKVDHQLYLLDSTGTETALGGGGGGGGSGTVTSVDLAMPGEFTVSGNPVTNAGTLTVAKAAQNANIIYAGPTGGGPAAPTFRSLVAADLPTVTVAKGGTGATSYTDKSIPFYDVGLGVLSEDNASLKYNSTSKQLTLGASVKFNNPAASESYVENTATDGDLRLSGGSSSTDGGTIYLFATGAGGGNGGDIDSVTGTGTSKFRWYEHSATNELFSITDTGVVTTEGGMTFKQLAGPSNPAAGYDICYTKANDKLYCKSSAGTETLIGPSVGSSGTVSIAEGGTGQTTQTAGFNALSPLTTKGDVIAHNGTNNIRVAVGTDGQVLTADSTQASGVKWATPSGGGGGGSGGAVKFTMNGALVAIDDFDSPYIANAAFTLSDVYVAMGHTGTSGSTDFTVNQYRAGVLITSVTGSYAASSEVNVGQLVSLSGSLSVLADDVLTIDLDDAAVGSENLDIIVASANMAGAQGPTGTAGNYATTTKSANYTATTSDNDIYLNPAGGSFTITLFTAVGNAGHHLNFKMISSGTVTFVTTGGQTIEFDTSAALYTQGQTLNISSDGSNWYVIQ